jgi:putative polyketide hydroxylase
MTPADAGGASPGPVCDVLIVGGGLTGLSAAVFLGCQGIRATVVEAHLGALIHPRARSVNPRTAEVLRQAGLETAVLSAATYVAEMPAVYMLRVDTLNGLELHRTEQRPPDSADGSEVSPCGWGAIDQDRLEQLLCERAVELGADVRFGTMLTGLTQDADGVTATVEHGPTGQRQVLRARYLIGADGSRSAVRRALGIPFKGPGPLSHVLSMVFEADLAGPLRGRHDPDVGTFIASCHCAQPADGTVLFPYGNGRRWVLNTPYWPDRGESPESIGEAGCIDRIRAAIGVPDLPVRLLPQLSDGTQVLGYEIAAAVAARFRAGRVFLAGDAAHVMPPTGAFGAGTGIQDAHNLAWKLAAVLSGRAGRALLESYEAERLPVARLTIGQALMHMRNRTGADVPVPEGTEPLDYDAVVFGYRYQSPVICPAESTGDGPGLALPPAELRGQPGTRAPHMETAAPGGRSVLDAYGLRHVLVTGPDAAGWAAAGRQVPGELDVLRVGSDLRVDPDHWARLHRITVGGALMIRPDGFVAWRAERDQPADEAAAALRSALGRLLCTA